MKKSIYLPQFRLNMTKLNKLYTSKLTPIKDIAKRNAKYKELSDEDKRKEIALDSLLLLSKNILLPTGNFSKLLRKEDGAEFEFGINSAYWNNHLDNIKVDMFHNSASSHEVQKALLNISEPLCKDDVCGVCARGAIMVSRIRLGNDISGYEISSSGTGDVFGLFGYDGLKGIEKIYEYGYEMNYPHRDALYLTNTSENMANTFLQIISDGRFDSERVCTVDFLQQYCIGKVKNRVVKKEEE